MEKLVILSGDQTGESSLSACRVSEGIRVRWGRHDRGRNDSRDQVVKWDPRVLWVYKDLWEWVLQRAWVEFLSKRRCDLGYTENDAVESQEIGRLLCWNFAQYPINFLTKVNGTESTLEIWRFLRCSRISLPFIEAKDSLLLQECAFKPEPVKFGPHLYILSLSFRFYILYHLWICRRISVFPKCHIYAKIKENF